jgi:farnesyl-diphosphate farnesyltransferase
MERSLEKILRDVSRSFYLTLKILPARERAPIALAYLLARAADNVADSTLENLSTKLKTLEWIRISYSRAHMDPLELPAFRFDRSRELRLFRQLPQILSQLNRLDAPFKSEVQKIVLELSQAMEWDLERLTPQKPGEICALKTLAETERYTYLAAGCVGAFWARVLSTALNSSRVDRSSGLSDEATFRAAIALGEGLQWCNILRDVREDLERGRLYWPESEILARAGLRPRDLRDRPECFEGPLTRLFADYALMATQKLEQGQLFVMELEHFEFRSRLASLWPLALALETLLALCAHGVNPLREHVKISRARVYVVLGLSLATVWLPRTFWLRLLGWRFRKLSARIAKLRAQAS